MTELTLPEGLKGSEVQKLSLEPGDILILKLPADMKTDQIAHNAHRFMRALTQHIRGVRTGILYSGMDLEIVRHVSGGDSDT